MKILVTGVAGFIGFHLARKLLERDDEIIGLDNLNNYYDINLKYARLSELGIQKNEVNYNKIVSSSRYENCKFIQLDIIDTNNLNKLFQLYKLDAICHLAAQAGVRYSVKNPKIYVESNITGFLNILEGCRRYEIKNLSYASSSSVYGLTKLQSFNEDDSTNHPTSLYAATKKSNEMMAHAYSHLYNISTTGLRFFTVYGPWGRPDMAPMLFTSAILENKPIKIFNYGCMSRDFTYIDDIIRGCIKVIDNPAQINKIWDPKSPKAGSSNVKYKIYNLGNSDPVNIMGFVQKLEKILAIKAQKQFLEMQSSDIENTCSDISKFMEDFDYKPLVSLDEGIEKFIEWYKQFYKVK